MTDPDVLARLDRVEALVARMAARLGTDRLDFLTDALRRATAGDWFTSGEILRLARAEATAAGAMGEVEPELAQALRLEGITTAHGLGRWIAARTGEGFERGGQERGGTQWRVLPE